MLWRSLKGALVSTAITFAIGAIVIALVIWVSYLRGLEVDFPEGHSVGILEILSRLALLSAIIGIPAGIASKLPRYGVRILPSIGVVTFSGLVGGEILSEIIHSQPHLKTPSPPPPHLAFFAEIFLMALVGGLIVFLIGRQRSRRFALFAIKEEASKSTHSE